MLKGFLVILEHRNPLNAQLQSLKHVPVDGGMLCQPLDNLMEDKNPFNLDI